MSSSVASHWLADQMWLNYSGKPQGVNVCNWMFLCVITTSSNIAGLWQPHTSNTFFRKPVKFKIHHPTHLIFSLYSLNVGLSASLDCTSVQSCGEGLITK